MSNLLERIRDYIRFLESQFGLDISVCDLHKTLFRVAHKIAPYHTHKNTFCIYVKRTPKLQKTCVLKQINVRRRCEKEECFFGTCYMGMSEYIFRLQHGNTYLGFISISSYCKDKALSYRKIERACKENELAPSDVKKIFNQTVRHDIPSLETLKPIIFPLCHLFELLYIKLSTGENEENDDSMIISKISNYISENYTNPIKIDDICNAVHYSRSYISHLFFKYYNRTIVYYINDLRINKAKELLISTNMTICEIALFVGFNDSNYFTNVFKKYTNMSPRRYRKLATEKTVRQLEEIK